MINEHASGIELRVIANRIHDKNRAFEFVLKMRRVHEHHEIMLRRKREVRVENLKFIARVLVQSDFTDAQHRLALQELWNERDDFARKHWVFRFFRINAEPCVMANAVLRSALRFEVGELAEVIEEALRRRAIVSRPKCGLGDSDATSERHALIVISGARHHVDMRIDVHVSDSPSYQDLQRTRQLRLSHEHEQLAQSCDHSTTQARVARALAFHQAARGNTLRAT